MRELLTRHIRSEVNPADLLTKMITEQMRNHLLPLVLYDIYDENTKHMASELANLFYG